MHQSRDLRVRARDHHGDARQTLRVAEHELSADVRAGPRRHAGDGNDIVIGNFGSDVLLGGKGDDGPLGDHPTGAPGTGHDACNGRQGTDFAVEGTCEQENQIEVTGALQEG